MDEWAWAIGLFEGEGCIRVTSRQTKLVLHMTDRDVVERFATAVGIGVARGPYPRANPKHKPMYRWEVTKWDDVEAILKRMLPYLGERRTAKAREALAHPFRSQKHLAKRNAELRARRAAGATVVDLAAEFDLSEGYVSSLTKDCSPEARGIFVIRRRRTTGP